MTPDDLFKRFAQEESFRWVPMSALKRGSYLACIDGRHSDCVIAAPGGDMGEFILLLTAIEGTLGEHFDERSIEIALRAVMDWHGRFYMHTDELCLEELAQALARDSRFDEMVAHDVKTTAELVQSGPQHLRDALNDYVLDPQFVGCGFLKMLLTDPGRMGVRRELVELAMRGFFTYMWSGATSAHYELLKGRHEEKAVLDISIRESARTDTTFVPSICGCDGGPTRLFVNHQPAREYLRAENLGLLADRGIVPPMIDEAEVMRRCDVLAAHQLSSVIQELAPDLPIFEVVFGDSTDEPTIKPVG